MNIAFWSNVRHQSGVTSGVALIGILWVELFEEEIAVTSNHICNFGLAKRLYGGSGYEERTAQKAYRYELGEPEYFRMLYSGKVRSTLWLNDNLRFIPMEGYKSDLFGAEGLRGVKKKVTENEYLLIDTACGCGLGSQKIMEEAELTVIILPSEKESVDMFFQSEISFKENSFFILGKYRTESSCKPSYLTSKYRIPRSRIGMIPYNAGFEQAMKEGSTIAYVTRNMNCSKRNNAYRFIRCATETVKKLREYANGRRDLLCGECDEV